jgi:hypothetical protein|tara:strand:- start:701 stop:889 length:189 start_codon:yes stop_codon:yes gene_type:complete
MKASSNCIVDDLKVVASCDGKQVDIFGSKGIAAAVGRLRMLLSVFTHEPQRYEVDEQIALID